MSFQPRPLEPVCGPTPIHPSSPSLDSSSSRKASLTFPGQFRSTTPLHSLEKKLNLVTLIFIGCLLLRLHCWITSFTRAGVGISVPSLRPAHTEHTRIHWAELYCNSWPNPTANQILDDLWRAGWGQLSQNSSSEALLLPVVSGVLYHTSPLGQEVSYVTVFSSCSDIKGWTREFLSEDQGAWVQLPTTC